MEHYDPFAYMTPPNAPDGEEPQAAEEKRVDAPKKEWLSLSSSEESPSLPLLACASLILGVLTLLCLPCSKLSLYSISCWLGTLSILMAVFAPRNKRGRMHGLAVAGLVCAILGILLALVYFGYDTYLRVYCDR